MRLKQTNVNGLKIWFRKGANGELSSDEQAIQEVLVGHCYRAARINFDVQIGDRVLDVGANIGSFAMYAHLREAASIACFEPDPENFKILKKNCPYAAAINAAITSQSAEFIAFGKSPNPANNYRNTEMPPSRYIATEAVRNVYGAFLTGQFFDFVKLDCEGSEGSLIDNWFIPHCEKLVLEYHTSRWPLLADLKRRIGILQDHFEIVKMPSLFARAIAGDTKGFPPRFDQLIFCMGEKK